MQQPKRIFMVAGEHSGDLLGGKLIEALQRLSDTPLIFNGVGGECMEGQGFCSMFPMSDVAVMGVLAILSRLPHLIRRVHQTVDTAVEFKPDLIVIIDSPEFTHPIAKRLRARLPKVPIIDYVSPTVWAWRPGRARKMKPYVDHLLALLPFEPEAHERLGGPKCSYVGHPMIEKVAWIDGLDTSPLRERLGLDPSLPVLTVLPGSRRSEIRHLMGPFGQAVQLLGERVGNFEMILPVVPSVRHLVEEALLSWPQQPHLVEGEEDKFRAFKLGRVALAASGTVTLELGIAGSPMVVAYRVDKVTEMMAVLLNVTSVASVVLANLVLGENAFPELLQDRCTPQELVAALQPLMEDSEERHMQLEGLAKIRQKLWLPEGTPSEAAARIVLAYLQGEHEHAAPRTEPTLERAT